MSDVKIASYNVNGIRAATRKGLYSLDRRILSDFICFQEMRSTEQDMPTILAELNYNKYHEIAQKKGYSGVSIFSTTPANAILNGIGVNWIDDEGRVLTAEYDDFRLVSAYFPSGTTGDLRQDMKMKFLDHFLRFTQWTLNGMGSQLLLLVILIFVIWILTYTIRISSIKHPGFCRKNVLG